LKYTVVAAPCYDPAMRFRRILRPTTVRGAIGRAALLVLIGLGIDAFWLEPSSLRVVEHAIVLQRADAGDIGKLRIAVIGDLHTGSLYIDLEKVRRVVALTNAAKPDLILLAGDYVHATYWSTGIPIEKTAAILKYLHAPLGVYAVIGNHDQWQNKAHVAAALGAVGITVLQNQSVAIRDGGRTLYLAGIGDFYTDAAYPERALADVPPGRAALCFTHSPDVFPTLPRTCLLTVAAHTHGGQVALPLIGRLIVPSHYGQRYAAGLVHEGDKYLFTSTGIGTSIIPVRFGVPPEISILTVSPRP
jgi:predicted MPP superfamily phosphohydrolase